ncbi:two-component system response regulator [Chloroflexus islandicus]|uniref:Two-component system response regulator n=1 Tax=Chloroflexus islandicus TaxID=1707952 RepID=A0A178M5A9_9CHLR|nr:response regulator [Chloroflexus islandicus]OAN42887.1 two-component system response regulator [Chloroflexus islandicus]
MKTSIEPAIILLVEDNPDHTELIIRTLNDHRIPNRIIHVTDGESALDYLWRRAQFADPATSPQPHIVLLDLQLPRLSGLEVLQEIKTSAETRHIPVVVVTTSSAERDLQAAYQRYANSYLVKPVDFQQFTQMLNDLGDYWLDWNQTLGDRYSVSTS